MTRFTSIKAAHEHSKTCKSRDHIVTRLKYPEPGIKTLFKNYNNQQKIPFVVYADFESIVKPYEGPVPESLPKTVILRKQEVCSLAILL